MILLQFTRDVGHPHPHLEDAIGNYLGFLETRGFDPAHVEAKLMSAHAEAGIAPSTHPVAEPSP